MQVPSSFTHRASVRQAALNLGVALLIAIVMTTAWTFTAWHDLSRLILPSADDVVRLAQIRDWLQGQATNDWTQYRMAPPGGTNMHWSRLADAGPAAAILLLTPFIGQHDAELAAIIVYPALLFTIMIWLNMVIGRQLWGTPGGIIAAVLTAVAYPGTTLFAPGRIDHHGLQAISIAVAILALMRAPRWQTGALVGSALAFSLMIGLETVPQAALLLGCAALFWILRGELERPRLIGIAAALSGFTLLFAATMRPTYWPTELCDAFTPASTMAILSTAVALALLAMFTNRLLDWRTRAMAGVILGGLALAATLMLFPPCRSFPYGAVEPFLRDNFLAHIDEAVSIFHQSSTPRVVSLIGPVAVASIASMVMMLCGTVAWRSMLPLSLVVTASTLVMFVQLRGVYIGGPLIPPILAGLVIAARQTIRWRPLILVLAWLASSGIVYLELPRAIMAVTSRTEQRHPVETPQRECRTDDVWRQLSTYPAGTVMTPINMAAYFLGMTHHSVVGSGYHRNNRGTLAMYRYFLSSPREAAAIAQEWQLSYVAFCPGDFTEGRLIERYPDSVAALLHTGRTPTGLESLPLRDARLRFYRIDRRSSDRGGP